jgi:hypothetical protein
MGLPRAALKAAGELEKKTSGAKRLQKFWDRGGEAGAREAAEKVSAAKKSGAKNRGIPHLAKNERDTPNFLYAALDRTACAPFF